MISAYLFIFTYICGGINKYFLIQRRNLLTRHIPVKLFFDLTIAFGVILTLAQPPPAYTTRRQRLLPPTPPKRFRYLGHDYTYIHSIVQHKNPDLQIINLKAYEAKLASGASNRSYTTLSERAR